jgi:hypothetical protein
MRSHLFPVLLFALASGVLSAQTTAPAQKPPAQNPAGPSLTVDEIVAKNLEARGGVDLLRATESMKMVGTVTSPAGQAKMTNWMKRPNRKRTETDFGGQKAVEAFDGTTPWVSIGGLPPQIIPPSPRLEDAKGRSEIDSPLLDYRARGRAVALDGREKADGGEVYHLRITERGQVTHYYLDATTFLEKKIMSRISDGQNTAQVELRFSDFRGVQGRMVPFTIQQIVDGKAVAQTKLDSVEFNIPIDDAMFKMPGAPR